jgi:hypothetical protein
MRHASPPSPRPLFPKGGEASEISDLTFLQPSPPWGESVDGNRRFPQPGWAGWGVEHQTWRPALEVAENRCWKSQAAWGSLTEGDSSSFISISSP